MDRIAGVRSSTRTIETFVNRVSPPTLTVDSYPPSESSFDGSGHVIAHILLHHCGHLTVVHLFTCFHWAINRGGQVDMSESGNSLINLGDWRNYSRFRAGIQQMSDRLPATLAVIE